MVKYGYEWTVEWHTIGNVPEEILRDLGKFGIYSVSLSPAYIWLVFDNKLTDEQLEKIRKYIEDKLKIKVLLRYKHRKIEE